MRARAAYLKQHSLSVLFTAAVPLAVGCSSAYINTVARHNTTWVYLHPTVLQQQLLTDDDIRSCPLTPATTVLIFNPSSGGSVTAGMGIYDAMMLCRADVQTYCFGLAASMGAFLLGAGKKGKRYSMPNSRIMIHQPLGGASGQAVDIEIQAKEIMYHKVGMRRGIAGVLGRRESELSCRSTLQSVFNPSESCVHDLILLLMRNSLLCRRFCRPT